MAIGLPRRYWYVVASYLVISILLIWWSVSHAVIPFSVAHVVVMPNVTRTKIDRFVDELNACRETYGQIQPLRPDSSLTHLGVPW